MKIFIRLLKKVVQWREFLFEERYFSADLENVVETIPELTY